MRLPLIILLLITSKFGCAQELVILKPNFGESRSYTIEEQRLWEKGIDNLYKINSGDIDYSELNEYDKAVIDSLEMEVGPMTESVGCSWYCGGGPYKITASSYLDNYGKTNYEPDNIHDFNLLTAWVPKGTIGMKINFHFKPFTPRINKLIIWNGYTKNAKVWKENARVAKFNVYVDGIPIYALQLQDVTNSQSFDIDPIQSQDSLRDLILTLEIQEIYPGTKYQDVAVGELNFDGLDVHCFAAGTKITMENGETTPIENIQAGNVIKSYDFESKEIVNSTVNKLEIARHSEITILKHSNGQIELTSDHPIWTNNSYWSSVNPNKSNALYHHTEPIQQLKIGDKLYLPVENEEIILTDIESKFTEQLMYTIDLSDTQNFIANGILVKSEIIKENEQ